MNGLLTTAAMAVTLTFSSLTHGAYQSDTIKDAFDEHDKNTPALSEDDASKLGMSNAFLSFSGECYRRLGSDYASMFTDAYAIKDYFLDVEGLPRPSSLGQRDWRIYHDQLKLAEKLIEDRIAEVGAEQTCQDIKEFNKRLLDDIQGS